MPNNYRKNTKGGGKKPASMPARSSRHNIQHDAITWMKIMNLDPIIFQESPVRGLYSNGKTREEMVWGPGGVTSPSEEALRRLGNAAGTPGYTMSLVEWQNRISVHSDMRGIIDPYNSGNTLRDGHGSEGTCDLCDLTDDNGWDICPSIPNTFWMSEEWTISTKAAGIVYRCNIKDYTHQRQYILDGGEVPVFSLADVSSYINWDPAAIPSDLCAGQGLVIGYCACDPDDTENMVNWMIGEFSTSDLDMETQTPDGAVGDDGIGVETGYVNNSAAITVSWRLFWYSTEGYFCCDISEEIGGPLCDPDVEDSSCDNADNACSVGGVDDGNGICYRMDPQFTEAFEDILVPGATLVQDWTTTSDNGTSVYDPDGTKDGFRDSIFVSGGPATGGNPNLKQLQNPLEQGVEQCEGPNGDPGFSGPQAWWCTAETLSDDIPEGWQGGDYYGTSSLGYRVHHQMRPFYLESTKQVGTVRVCMRGKNTDNGGYYGSDNWTKVQGGSFNLYMGEIYLPSTGFIDDHTDDDGVLIGEDMCGNFEGGTTRCGRWARYTVGGCGSNMLNCNNDGTLGPCANLNPAGGPYFVGTIQEQNWPPKVVHLNEDCSFSFHRFYTSGGSEFTNSGKWEMAANGDLTLQKYRPCTFTNCDDNEFEFTCSQVSSVDHLDYIIDSPDSTCGVLSQLETIIDYSLKECECCNSNTDCIATLPDGSTKNPMPYDASTNPDGTNACDFAPSLDADGDGEDELIHHCQPLNQIGTPNTTNPGTLYTGTWNGSGWTGGGLAYGTADDGTWSSNKTPFYWGSNNQSEVSIGGERVRIPSSVSLYYSTWDPDIWHPYGNFNIPPEYGVSTLYFKPDGTFKSRQGSKGIYEFHMENGSMNLYYMSSGGAQTVYTSTTSTQGAGFDRGHVAGQFQLGNAAIWDYYFGGNTDGSGIWRTTPLSLENSYEGFMGSRYSNPTNPELDLRGFYYYNPCIGVFNTYTWHEFTGYAKGYNDYGQINNEWQVSGPTFMASQQAPSGDTEPWNVHNDWDLIPAPNPGFILDNCNMADGDGPCTDPIDGVCAGSSDECNPVALNPGTDGALDMSGTGYELNKTSWRAGVNNPQPHSNVAYNLLGPDQTCTWTGNWIDIEDEWIGACQTYAPAAPLSDRTHCRGGVGQAGGVMPPDLPADDRQTATGGHNRNEDWTQCPAWDAGVNVGPQFYWKHAVIECAKQDWCANWVHHDGSGGPPVNYMCHVYLCDCDGPPANSPVVITLDGCNEWSCLSAYSDTQTYAAPSMYFDPYLGPHGYCTHSYQDFTSGKLPPSGCGWLDFEGGIYHGTSYFWTPSSPYYSSPQNNAAVGSATGFLSDGPKLKPGNIGPGIVPKDSLTWYQDYESFVLNTDEMAFTNNEIEFMMSFNEWSGASYTSIGPDKYIRTKRADSGLGSHVITSGGYTWRCKTHTWVKEECSLLEE